MEKRQHGLINKTGVYAIIINNIIRYVGSTFYSLESRKSNHLANLRKNKHHNHNLQTEFNKYGESKTQFKVIEYYDGHDRLELLGKEKHWIDYYKSTIFNKAEVTDFCIHDRHIGDFKGTNNPNNDTNIETVVLIKLLIVEGLRNTDIADITGKTQSYISLIRTGKRWKHLDYKDYILNDEYPEYEGISLRDN